MNRHPGNGVEDSARPGRHQATGGQQLCQLPLIVLFHVVLPLCQHRLFEGLGKLGTLARDFDSILKELMNRNQIHFPHRSYMTVVQFYCHEPEVSQKTTCSAVGLSPEKRI